MRSNPGLPIRVIVPVIVEKPRTGRGMTAIYTYYGYKIGYGVLFGPYDDSHSIVDIEKGPAAGRYYVATKILKKFVPAKYFTTEKDMAENVQQLLFNMYGNKMKSQLDAINKLKKIEAKLSIVDEINLELKKSLNI